MQIELVYPDGTAASHALGTTGADVARSIGPRLAAAAIAVALDDQLLDLSRPIDQSGKFRVITVDSDEGRQILRHSAAHILAQAVLSLYPGSHFGIGPAIEDGFYYDFDIGRPFTPEDLEQIEARMREITAEDQPFERSALSAEEALEVFSDQPLKKEIIASVDPSEVEDAIEVTVYRNRGFVDLCRGPHLPSTGRLGAFKLLRTAGAYWRGDEKRQQLQRIYGTAWESDGALAEYLHRVEEAERRDHRRLGQELDLYSFPRELGPGLAVWHQKGGMFRKVVEDHSRRLHERFGFEFVVSPHLAREVLWDISGHLGFYAENMYPGMEVDEGESYRVKPMNCPFHILVYRSRGRSYRELPLRLSELGAVYRRERSGVLHGLLRVRGFTQDDSHTFCRADQLDSELALHLDFVTTWMRDFGFTEFEADLSTKPEKSVGDPTQWEAAEKALEKSLEDAGINYRIADGEGAFYGPKIDVHIRDAIGRRWQMSTIQFDFNMPARFELTYTTSDNQGAVPFMIHCAKAGSIDRFLAVVVEHYAGALPAWLAPVQVSVLSVADRHLDYAGEVAAAARRRGLRVEVDHSSETVGEKIRRALTQKHPFLLVVGDKDVEANTVGFRRYGEERDQRGVALSEALSIMSEASSPPGM
jgi:threonyl-tRNA synthetase